jgi:uncharacterized Zn-finger protein
MEPKKIDANVWECPICGFRAMSRKVIEDHMRRQHKIDPTPKQVQNNTNPMKKGNKGKVNNKGNGKRRKTRQ